MVFGTRKRRKKEPSRATVMFNFKHAAIRAYKHGVTREDLVAQLVQAEHDYKMVERLGKLPGHE